MIDTAAHRALMHRANSPPPYTAELARDEDDHPIYDDDIGGFQWYVCHGNTECLATTLAGPMPEVDAKAVASAMNAVPALLDEIDRLRAALAAKENEA